MRRKGALKAPFVERPQGTIPIEAWGKDHISTLAYIETRAVDHNGWLANDQMRMDPDQHPLLTGARRELLGAQTLPGQYPTILIGKWRALDHDDWDCLIDMVEEGILRVLRVAVHRPEGGWNGASPPYTAPYRAQRVCVRVAFTRPGARLAGELREHLAIVTAGIRYASFQPSREAVAACRAYAAERRRRLNNRRDRELLRTVEAQVERQQPVREGA